MLVNDGCVVCNFIVQALKGEDITILGDGSQTRSFCFINDMAEGFVRMMATPNNFIGPVNLGNPAECSILELAETIKRLTGSKSAIVHYPPAPDDPLRRRPDVCLAKEKLASEPRVSFEEGLKRTIAYFDRLP